MVIELDKSTYRSNHHTIFMGRDIYIIGANTQAEFVWTYQVLDLDKEQPLQ